MRIEFQTIGDGTNVQVLLIDEQIPGWGTVALFYTSQHHFDLTYSAEGMPYPWESRSLFSALEEMSAQPKIGGYFADFHPYWKDHPKQKEKLQ